MSEWILELIVKTSIALASTLLAVSTGVLLGKILGKVKTSKLRSYVMDAVKAAEQLYPNEGKKMGPEKYAYVVESVMQRYPKTARNLFIKNMIEAAVYTMNQEMLKKSEEQTEADLKEKPVEPTVKKSSTLSSF